MSADPQNQDLSSGDLSTNAATSESSEQTELGSTEGSSGAQVVAPESPVTAEPPEAFTRLKEYCDKLNLKTEIDLQEPFQNISLEFKNGRVSRTVYIGTEESADALLHYPLDEIVFLGEYSAICSYKGSWIEAAVRPHGVGGARGFVARRRIFGIAGVRREDRGEVEISSAKGMTLRLTEKPGLLYLLDYGAQMYLRIEGIGIAEHDKAMNLLEDLSNSLFLQIDFRFETALTIPKGRTSSRRFRSARGKLDEDNALAFPRFAYDRSPSSLYWYARSALSMPLLQFLSFYQCLEFYFPHYSRQETIAKIKNILKSPLFDGAKDSSINVVVNATLEGHRGSLLEERKQLAATLRHCIDATALRDFLTATDERKRYFEHDYKKISQKRIVLSEGAPVVEQTADRIYDIRCKVVHTKNLDAGEGDEIILPFSHEEQLMIDDVELVQFLARNVLIASSTPLNV
jgi:hypothetical protein